MPTPRPTGRLFFAYAGGAALAFFLLATSLRADEPSPTNTNADAAAIAEVAESPDVSPSSPQLPLAPPGKESGAKSDREAPIGSWNGLIAAGVVAVVAGAALFFLRPAGGASNLRPPEEVVAVLGRTPLADRQSLHVVQFGAKLLLINVSAGTSRTLSEIDDPREVERLVMLCRGETKRPVAPKRVRRGRETVDA